MCVGVYFFVPLVAPPSSWQLSPFLNPPRTYTHHSLLPRTQNNNNNDNTPPQSGDLVEIKRFFVQGGIVIPHPSCTNIPPGNFSSISDAFCKAKGVAFSDNDNFETFGGLKRMGEVMDGGMVLVLSQWVDFEAHMLWLDSTYPVNATGAPGASRGSCDITSGNPPDVIQNNPNAKVSFSKISLGPIGFSFRSER